MNKTPEWITEEKVSRNNKEVIQTVKHSSLPKAIRSILARIYKVKNVNMFYVTIPGIKTWVVYRKKESNDE